VTTEERVALTLMGPDAIRRRIDELRALQNQSVGWLYPSILADEIAELWDLLRRIPVGGVA